jgi:hypothetical protein
VLDNFDTKAHVNAYRIPVIVFGATETLEREMTFKRKNGSIEIAIFPREPNDYGGYLSYFPPHVPPGLKTLELHWRGRIPPEMVRIGLRDQKDREARISLISYLRPPGTTPVNNTPKEADKDAGPAKDYTNSFQTVRIPIEAFRATLAAWYEGRPDITNPKSVSVTMLNAGPEIDHEMELGPITLDYDVAPLVIAKFDDQERDKTNLGGVIVLEAVSGAKLEADFETEGYESNGIELAVTNARPEGYAVVAFNTGRLDTLDYSHLTLWVRGERGHENMNIYLNDGKKRASVNISEYLKVTTTWKQVRIPLQAFKKKGVAISKVEQIVFAWEGRVIEREVLYIDELLLE